MASVKNIVTTVREGISPIAKELGYLLWDVEYVREGARRVLRVTIDSDHGITIEDCERMHRAIDPVLDEIDPIEGAYDLEVSSPGIERDLRTDVHIDACVGEDVEVRFFAPFEGQKSMKGVLAGREGDQSLLLDINGEIRALPRAAIAKIRTVFEF
jgi:ribosome maturation factor RimP